MRATASLIPEGFHLHVMPHQGASLCATEKPAAKSAQRCSRMVRALVAGDGSSMDIDELKHMEQIMNDSSNNTPENFQIRSEVLPLVHRFIAESGVTPTEIVIAASVIVAVSFDLDEGNRIAWLQEVTAGGWCNHETVNLARDVMKEIKTEIAEAQADDTRP